MKTALFTGALFLALSATGQDYKLAKSTGTLEIKEVNHVTVEGTTGNEIIFSSRPEERDHDADVRSKGLRAISSSGVEDNTGLGISVVDKGTTYEVRQLKKMDGPEIKILVPKGVNVYYEHTSPHGETIIFRNVEGKIEVNTVHSGVTIENATGPVSVKTVHGDIEAVFTSVNNSVSLESVHAPVDVTMPASAKVNLSAKTAFGQILVDPDFKLEIQRGSGGLVKYNDGVSAKINGGGVNLELESTHNSVYLRKK